jgi:hypothetical protein
MIHRKMGLVLGTKRRIVKKISRRSRLPKTAPVGQQAMAIKMVKLPDKEQYKPSLLFSFMHQWVWARRVV